MMAAVGLQGRRNSVTQHLRSVSFRPAHQSIQTSGLPLSCPCSRRRCAIHLMGKQTAAAIAPTIKRWIGYVSCDKAKGW